MHHRDRARRRAARAARLPRKPLFVGGGDCLITRVAASLERQAREELRGVRDEERPLAALPHDFLAGYLLTFRPSDTPEEVRAFRGKHRARVLHLWRARLRALAAYYEGYPRVKHFFTY